MLVNPVIGPAACGLGAIFSASVAGSPEPHVLFVPTTLIVPGIAATLKLTVIVFVVPPDMMAAPEGSVQE